MATGGNAMVSRPKLDGKVPVHASTYRNVGTSSKQRLVPLRSVTRAVSSNRIYSRTRIGFFSQIIFERESTLNGKRRTGTIRPTQSEGFRAEASGTHEEKTGNERKTLFALKGFSSEGGHQEARPDNADNQTKAWDVLGSGEEQNARNRMSADVADDVSKDQSAEQREGMQTKGNQEGWEEREAAWERMKVPKLTAVGTPYPSTWVRLFQIVRSQPMRVFHIVRAHPEEKEGGRTEQKREKRDAQKEKGDAQNEKADQQEKGRGEDLWKEGKGVEEKQGMGVSVMDISDERKKIRDKLEEEKGPEQQRRRDEQETGIGDERKSIGNEQQGTEPDEAAKQAVRVAGLEKDRQEERVEKRVRARKAEKKAKEEATLSPHSHPVSEWSTQEVVTWAADQGFLTTKVDVHRFLRAKIAGADLPYWTSEDFEEIGLPKGPAKRLVRAINELAVCRTIRVQFPFDCVPADDEEEADVTDDQESDASPDAILTAEVTLRDDEELTEFLGEMCALGLVRIRDEFDESATSAAAESDTSATESGEGATSATGTPAKLARSIWELESGGLYMPFYSGV